MTDARTAPTILVVDDDEGLQLLMAEALRGEGYEVATAGSGSAALAWLEKHTPDLMLLDLKMQDVGGQALVQRLKKHHGPIPFLVVTGQGDEKVAVEVMKQGALDYVMKDTGMLDLLPGIVRRAIETIKRDRMLASTQASLRESEARFAAAVRATNEGVWEWRLADDSVYFSPRWKAILGYEPEELADTMEEWRKRVHPQDAVRVERTFREFLEGRETMLSVEYRLRHKDGAYRWILSRVFLDRDHAGRPVRVTGANADITERKQLEKEILSISDREQRRIGQDLHDGLGQQLTAIEFMCQSLKADLQSGPPAAVEQVSQMGKFLRDAVTQTRALAHGLTAFMLDASGLQPALAELAVRTEKAAKVRCRFDCPAPVAVPDSETAAHLYRIAQEAVTNAVKHAGADEIEISLAAAGDQLVLRISDNGKGLRASKRSANGIGLQVMRHRADTIGAELTVDSKRGKGVTVTCTLRRNG